MARPAADGFSWTQFRVLFRAMFKGENMVDSLGINSFGGGATAKRRRRLTLTPWLSKAFQALLFAGLAVLLFFLGEQLAGQGPAPLLRALSVMLVLITLMTGVYSAVNLLYYAKDNSYYLTLPVSPTALMWAKLVNYLVHAMLGGLILLPIGLGALWFQGAPAVDWVRMAAAFLIGSLTVNLAIAALCIVLLRFSRLARDKDRFSQAFGVIMMVVAIGLGIGIQFVVQGDDAAAGALDALSRTFAEGPAAWALAVVCMPALVAEQIFSTSPLGVLAGFAASVLSLLVWVLLLSVLAGRWYLDGMRSFQGAGGRRSTRRFEADELASLVGARGPIATAFDRDWKTMLRTPVFFNQFVLSPLLMPVYFIAIFAVVGFITATRDGADLTGIFEMIGAISAEITFGSFPLLVAAFGLLAFRVFMGMSGYGTALAVSRDGEDFFFLRALPVNWRAYLASKLLTSIHGDALVLLVIAILLLVARVPLASTGYLLLLLLAASLSLSLFALAQGAFFPRLHWENEAQVVKGGSAFIQVYLTMILGAVACALPGLILACPLFFEIDIPLDAALVGALIAQVLVALVLAWVVFVPAARSLSRREP